MNECYCVIMKPGKVQACSVDFHGYKFFFKVLQFKRLAG